METMTSSKNMAEKNSLLMTLRLTVALLVPAALEAWHWYIPWSSSLISLILKELPVARIWNREFTIVAPFRVQDWSGMGSPVAVQRRVVAIPVTAVTILSSAMIRGPTAKQNNKRCYLLPPPTAANHLPLPLLPLPLPPSPTAAQGRIMRAERTKFCRPCAFQHTPHPHF